MVVYYLGVPVEIDSDVVDGWVWAAWPDGRPFKFWADQLMLEPWGQISYLTKAPDALGCGDR
jgi:hypothetical protein